MNETKGPVAGGCFCGGVRYTVAAEPVAVRTCWCRDCQYLGAGSATVNVFFPAEAVAITGPLARFDSIADSGSPMIRTFCPVCGTQVTTASAARPDVLGLRVGTLDDPSAFSPQVTIWTGSAPHWAPIDRAIPHDPGQPAPIRITPTP